MSIVFFSASPSLLSFLKLKMRVLGLFSNSIITPLSTSSSSSSSSLRNFPVLIQPSSRLFYPTRILQLSCQVRPLSSTPKINMSFSNTSVPGDKPADPYKATNLTNPDLKEKVQDLVTFMEACKFGMMTTRIESSGLLTSRCMALAAKVSRSYRGPPSCLVVYVVYENLELTNCHFIGRRRR